MQAQGQLWKPGSTGGQPGVSQPAPPHLERQDAERRLAAARRERSLRVWVDTGGACGSTWVNVGQQGSTGVGQRATGLKLN